VTGPRQGAESGAERRYKRLLAGLELTRDFFWSYGWPLWRSVQANLGAAAPGSPFDSMFVWNDFLTRRAPAPAAAARGRVGVCARLTSATRQPARQQNVVTGASFVAWRASGAPHAVLPVSCRVCWPCEGRAPGLALFASTRFSQAAALLRDTHVAEADMAVWEI